MKTKKTLGWILALGMIGSASMFGACSQPKTECQTALPSIGYAFATKYKLKAPPKAGCEDLVQIGELVGMEFYHPPSADGLTYDATKTTFAIQADSFGAEVRGREAAAGYVADRGLGCDADPNPCVDTNEAHHLYATGTFASNEPNDADICTVNMAASAGAKQEFPAIPEVPEGADPEAEPAQDAIPAATLSMEWSDVKVYVTAASPGTQFSASVKVTRDSCVLEYEAVGLWPAIYCEGADADGNPIPDDTLCDPCAPEGAAYGSGISPDFATKCDPVMFYCVLKDAKDTTKDAATIPQILSTPKDCGPI